MILLINCFFVIFKKILHRVNYYSSSNVTYKNMPTGDANNDNAKLLSDRRFVMAAVGDDSSSTC